MNTNELDIKIQAEWNLRHIEEVLEYATIQTKRTIQEINNEDSSAAYLEYKAKLDTAIEYPANGHLYKPKWAEEVYAGLIQKGVLCPKSTIASTQGKGKK